MNSKSTNPVVEIPGSQFDQEAKAATLPVLAHFYSTWCEQCRILAPSLQQLAEEFVDELKIVAVNLDLCPEVAASYGITRLPTLELFDGGVPIASLDVGMPRQELKVELQGLLADYAKKKGVQSGSQPVRENQSAGQFSISTVVKLPFDWALRETVRALKEEELVIITEIDLQAQLAAKLSLQIRPYTILGVWAPSWEYEALSREPDIGLLMPSHVCLWDNGDGTCTLATADLKHLCHVEQNTPLAQAARAVNARLRAVVSSVQFAGAVEERHASSHAVRSGTGPAGVV